MREPEPAVAAPALKSPSLGISVFWTLAGYGVYMACQWAMLIVVARLGSPEKVGQLALGIALTAPVVLFTNLGLRKVQVTDTKGQFHFSDYFGLRLLMNTLAMGLVAAVAVGGGYDRAAAGTILAVGLAKAVEATSDVVYGVLQHGERMDLIAGSLFLRGVVGVGGLALVMVFTHDVALGMLGVAVGWIAVLFLYDLRKARQIQGDLSPRWSPRILGRLAWVALPLGIVTPIAALMASVPAVLIEKWKGAAELGIYTALAYSYAASNRIASAMGEGACARLARDYAQGRRTAFARALGTLLLASGLVGVAGLVVSGLAGKRILTFLYGPAYGERSDVLIGFMLVAVAGNLAVVLDYSMTAMRRLKIQPLLAGVSVLIYAVLCAHLIPAQGLRGAVLALGTVALVQGAATLGIVALGWLRFPSLSDPLAAGEA